MQLLAVIMVAGQQVQRHVQRGQQCAQLGIGCGAAIVHQVTGQHGGIGAALQGGYGTQGLLQQAGSIDLAIGQFTCGQDMQIGQLEQ